MCELQCKFNNQRQNVINHLIMSQVNHVIHVNNIVHFNVWRASSQTRISNFKLLSAAAYTVMQLIFKSNIKKFVQSRATVEC